MNNESAQQDERKDGDTPLLRVQNLTTSFQVDGKEIDVIRNVTFDVLAGSILGIVGESGSGKSVTARSILRLLRAPGKVRIGTVELRGQNLLALPEHKMREIRGQDIAMVFQDPQTALNPVMRVGDQIREALLVHGVSADIAQSRARELFHQVGIPDVERTLSQYPHEFSGGMRQRVVIAIALANKPSLLIADEPTTALDVTIQAQILRLLAELRHELGISIIMITHDMGVVAELCDDLIVMYGGRVVEQSTVKEVFNTPSHPYTSALLKAMPRIDSAGSSILEPIPGAPPIASRLPAGCAFHPRCDLATEQCKVDVPDLFEISPSHRSACWVAKAGLPVAKSQTGQKRARPETEQTQPVLNIKDLRTDVAANSGGMLSKAKPVFAVDGITLEVFPGKTLGLVGESGCGKSSLSRTIVGINTATEGAVIVDGHDVTGMNPDQRQIVNNTIQYIFQDPSASLNPRRTVGQSLEEALSVVGVMHEEARKQSLSLMKRVGLDELHIDRYPHELSGGQRQRVGIARAIAVHPKMLICDEPVSALDVSIQAQIIELLEELRDSLGLAFLFIAHDLSVVRHISDTVAVMYLGQIVEVGKAEDVYGTPQHPYTAALLSSTPNPDPDLEPHDRNRILLTGDMPSAANPPTGCRFRTRCPIGPLFFPERQVCVTDPPALSKTSAGQNAACHFAGDINVLDAQGTPSDQVK